MGPSRSLVSKLPVDVRGATRSHQEIDQMKRGHGVISHYKFASVRWINMHNLGCDLNAKYKHTHTHSPPAAAHPSHARSRATNRAPWLARVIGAHVLRQWETDRLLDLLLAYLLLLLLGVGSD